MAIIQTYPTAEVLAHAAAELFVTLAQESIRDHGHFSVALAGGSTPRAMYKNLATIEFTQQVNWERVYIFWSDERCVPPESEDSNYHMARDAFLKYVAIPPENILRMQGEIKPHQAAQSYEETLTHFFAPKPTRFDLILLGMGDDGHTASIFPATPAIHEAEKLVMAQYVDKLESWRITFTPALINAAANVAFLVSGEKKAYRLRQVIVGRYQPDQLPAQIVRPAVGKLRWLLDEAAAIHVTSTQI